MITLSTGRLKQEDCRGLHANLGNSMSGCVKTTKQSWKKGYGGVSGLERRAVTRTLGPVLPPTACTLPSSRLTPSQSNSMVRRGAFLRGSLRTGFRTRWERRPQRSKLPQRTIPPPPAPCSRRTSGRMHPDAALAQSGVDRTQRPGDLGVPPLPVLSSPCTPGGFCVYLCPKPETDSSPEFR